MNTNRRLRVVTLVTAAAMLFAACAGSAELVDASAATSADSQVDSGVAAPESASEPTAVVPAADTEGAETEPAAETSTSSSGVPSGMAVVTIDGEQMMFDMLICSTFGPEFLGGTGLPGEGAPADSEFVISYEKPLPGDGENSEYDNTVRVEFGNDSWKAGAVTGGVGAGEWGSLDWTRDGDMLSGTATLEHAWGENPGEPRQATFAVNCG